MIFILVFACIVIKFLGVARLSWSFKRPWKVDNMLFLNVFLGGNVPIQVL